jgi:clathrin heavy chain
MFTVLGEVLAKYHPERVMEHLRLFWSRVQIPKLIRACEDAHLWRKSLYIFSHAFANS